MSVSLRSIPEGLEHLRKRSTVLSLWRHQEEEAMKNIPLRKEVIGKLIIHLEMSGKTTQIFFCLYNYS